MPIMKNRSMQKYLAPFLILAALLVLVACPTTDEPPTRFLDMKIDKDNDSLLAFDSLIIKVYSKDSSFSQEVFHGVLRDPAQVSSMPLDPRIGKEYTISIVGFKGGKVGVTKQVTVLGPGNFQSKDIPPIKPPDTIVITPQIPEILAPADTFVSEGDSLRIRITVRNPWSAPTTLTLKETIAGAALDTEGRAAGDSYFTWRPTFDQGRAEAYAVTFAYTSAEKKIEKLMRVKVLNVNRPPKIAPIADQKAKENESLTFKVQASDPDLDSLILIATNLPTGASFTGNTFTWKPSEGQANNYSVKFKAFDGSDSDQVAVLITVGNVDVPPPVTVKITSPAHDTSINFTPITILYTVNGALMQKKYGLINGKNRIRVDTTILGRTGFDTVWITLDTVPPGAPVVSGASPVRTRTPAWTWVSGGNGSSTYRYRLDSEDMAGATLLAETFYTASKDLNAGLHTLFVQERDSAGNWSQTGKSSVRIDTTRPAAPMVTTSPSSPTPETRPIWNWSAFGDDVPGVYRFQLDNDVFKSTTLESQVTSFKPEAKDALQEGLHTLYVQQRDSAGNWSNSGSASILVDFTPSDIPKVTTVQASPTNVSKPTWNWAGGTGGIKQFRIKLDDSVMSVGTISSSKTTFTPDSTLKEGTHTLYVQERDSAGNWSNSGSAQVRVDLTAPAMPTLSLGQPSPTNLSKPVWNWKSGGLGGSGDFRYKLDDTTLSNNPLTGRSLTFAPDTSLKAGNRTFYIQERDSAGNWSARASLSLVVDLTPPNKPSVSAFTYQTEDATPTWHWTSGGNGGAGAYRWKVDDSSMTTGSTTTTDTSAFPSSDLTSGAAHTMFVQERDSAGNWSQIGYFQIRIHGQVGFAYQTGLILRTTNGGLKWDSIPFSGGQGLFDMHFPSPQTGYAVGYQGTVVKTTNGGLSWNAINTGLDNFFFVIWFTSTTIGYAAGEYGKIFKTTNGGASWQELPAKGTGFIYGMQFIDANTGYVGAEDGVFRTTNAGATWEAVPTGFTDGYWAVHFIDLKRGFVGGSSGAIYATTDGGANWKKLSTGATSSVERIVFTDQNIGYATIHKSYARTSDGGKTWSVYNGTKDLYNAIFTGSNTGYAVNSDGDLAKATDAFMSWNTINPGTINNPGELYFP